VTVSRRGARILFRRSHHAGRLIVAVAALLLWLAPGTAAGQDLEPRRWTHLPMNLNIVGAGMAAIDGDITFDPVLRIEEGTFELYTAGSSYIRTFEWLGKSSRIDFRVPYGYGRWEGLLDGAPASVRRHGLMDPRIRLSMNLWGAPPLSGKAWFDYHAQHPVNTTVGIGATLVLPLGEYLEDRLINLGQNRYVLRPHIGVLHTRGPWQFELTGSLSFYGDNDAFYGGSLLEQDWLGFLQAHVIRTFARGIWGSLTTGYSFGGEARVDRVPKNNEERTRYFALNVGVPLTRAQSIKLTWVNAETNVLLGTSSNSVLVGWSVAWGE
jgi:hypothetical protein